jgi:3-methylfumaryl-CoA hydratase
MSLDLAHLRQWVGRSETREERIAPFPSNALAATLDRADPVYAEGTALPALWHWLHFRRMWAGSRLRFLRPLVIGAEARRVSTVTDVALKSGKSGDLVFVTVRHEVFVGKDVAIEEEHDIVYRTPAEPGAPAPAPVAAPADAQWTYPVQPDAVLLFRYSALTFNSHRIHYDLDYVTRVEGYTGLVVHGPLIATLLLDGLRRARPEARVTAFTFRAIAPTVHTDRFAVRGRIEAPGKARVWAEKEGALTMDGTAEFEE